MARQSQEEVAAAARRRLELLRRELEQAGLRRVEDDEPLADPVADGHGLPPPEAVSPPGRHVRPSRAPRVGGWLRAQVPAALAGRVGLARGPVLLVVALVSVAVLVTAVSVLRMGGQGEVVAPSTTQPSPLVPAMPASSGVAGAVTTPSAAASRSASGTVTVDVAGKVRRPGVATLPAGSRVVDALRRAGGARGGVDVSGLNLARVLVDGEQILVGRPAAPSGVAASASTTGPPATGALVNLNTATEEQLDTLPGVGPVTAQKILQWRTAHGAFSAVDELLDIDGIGEKTLADLAPLVTL